MISYNFYFQFRLKFSYAFSRKGKKKAPLMRGLNFFDKSYNFYQNLQVFSFKTNVVPVFCCAW